MSDSPQVRMTAWGQQERAAELMRLRYLLVFLPDGSPSIFTRGPSIFAVQANPAGPQRPSPSPSTKTSPPSFTSPARRAIVRASPDPFRCSLTPTSASMASRSSRSSSGATCRPGCPSRATEIFEKSGALPTNKSEPSRSGCGRALQPVRRPMLLRSRSSFPAGSSASRTW